jgi:hypothetical protein
MNPTSPGPNRLPGRLGRNRAGYAGESIDVDAVLRDDVEAARRFGWQIEWLLATPELRLLTLQRHVPAPRARLYFSTGIHGDEPAGPLAIRELLTENAWPATSDLWLCPCLNPTGFRLSRRENARAVDLNRDYRHLTARETQAHVDWLKRQPRFDLAVCLHEDWEAHGFYLYELNPDGQPSLAEQIVAAVSRLIPIDHSAIIDDRPARQGIIRPDLDPSRRPHWPEAFYLIVNQTRHSYTLEAPSDFPLPARVAALVTAVRAATRGQS